MAIDRIIRFPDPADVPTLELLRIVAEDYVGDAVARDGGLVVTQYSISPHLLFVSLPGKASYSFQRIFPDALRAQAMLDQQPQPRWFEIDCCGLLPDRTIDPDNPHPWVDVMTRPGADDFTLAVADGFARIVARFWGGVLEASE